MTLIKSTIHQQLLIKLMTVFTGYMQSNQRILRFINQHKLAIAVTTYVVVFVVIAFVISLRSSHDTTESIENISGFTDQIDNNSGDVVMHGQSNPEINDIPNSPAVYGIDNLSSMGISDQRVQDIRNILRGYYANYNINNKDNKINTVSIGKDIVRDRDNTIGNGSNTYTASFQVNEDSNQTDTIIIVIFDNGDLSISIKSPEGIDTIYNSTT